MAECSKALHLGRDTPGGVSSNPSFCNIFSWWKFEISLLQEAGLSAGVTILTEDVVFYTEYNHMNLGVWKECLKLAIVILPIMVTKNRLLSEW